MTVTDHDVDLDDLTFLDSEAPHVVCCRDKHNLDTGQGPAPARFLCGLAFHPEMVGDEADPDEELCRSCVEVGVHQLCPPMRPTHMHCPFTGEVCP